VIKGFDFEGAPEPTDDLRRVQLIKGDGPRVKKGQTIAVRYLGQAWGEDKPFDENFGDTGTGAPTTFSIGTGAVIKGWDQGLEGVPVGSRVVCRWARAWCSPCRPSSATAPTVSPTAASRRTRRWSS